MQLPACALPERAVRVRRVCPSAAPQQPPRGVPLSTHGLSAPGKRLLISAPLGPDEGTHGSMLLSTDALLPCLTRLPGGTLCARPCPSRKSMRVSSGAMHPPGPWLHGASKPARSTPALGRVPVPPSALSTYGAGLRGGAIVPRCQEARCRMQVQADFLSVEGEGMRAAGALPADGRSPCDLRLSHCPLQIRGTGMQGAGVCEGPTTSCSNMQLSTDEGRACTNVGGGLSEHSEQAAEQGGGILPSIGQAHRGGAGQLMAKEKGCGEDASKWRSTCRAVSTGT